jgi:hypothetical protein
MDLFKRNIMDKIKVGDKIRVKKDPNVFPEFWGVVGFVTKIDYPMVHLKSDNVRMHGELKDVELCIRPFKNSKIHEFLK